MKFEPPKNTSKPRESLGSILAFSFIIVWLFGLFVATLGWTCLSNRFEGNAKLGFCNAAIVTSSWTRLSPRGRAKGAKLHLERGIALSQLGRNDQARIAFERALRNVNAVSGSWQQDLPKRMITVEDDNALEIWSSVVDPTK